jgi:hypothetical protein
MEYGHGLCLHCWHDGSCEDKKNDHQCEGERSPSHYLGWSFFENLLFALHGLRLFAMWLK